MKLWTGIRVAALAAFFVTGSQASPALVEATSAARLLAGLIRAGALEESALSQFSSLSKVPAALETVQAMMRARESLSANELLSISMSLSPNVLRELEPQLQTLQGLAAEVPTEAEAILSATSLETSLSRLDLSATNDVTHAKALTTALRLVTVHLIQLRNRFSQGQLHLETAEAQLAMIDQFISDQNLKALSIGNGVSEKLEIAVSDPLRLSSGPLIRDSSNAILNLRAQLNVSSAAAKNPALAYLAARRMAESEAKKLVEQVRSFQFTISQRLDLAKLVIRKSDDEFLAGFENFDLTESQLLDVLQTSRSNDTSEILNFITKILPSLDLRFEFLTSRLGPQTRLVLDNIDLLNGRADLQIKILENSIGKWSAFDNESFVNAYRRVSMSQEKRFEIAKRIARPAGTYLIRILPELNFTPDQLHQLAPEFLAFSKEAFLAFVVAGHVDSDAAFQILLELAPTQSTLVKDMSVFTFLSPDQRYLLARQNQGSAQENVYYQVAQWGLSPEQRFQLAKLQAQAQPEKLQEDLANFTLGEKERYKIAIVTAAALQRQGLLKKLNPSKFDLSADYQIKLQSTLVKLDPTTAFSDAGDLNLSNAPSIEDLRSQLAKLARTHPDLAPESLINILWDRIQKREVGLRLFEEGVRQILNGRAVPHDSLALLTSAIGIPETPLRNPRLSDSAVSQVYEFGLDIQENLRGRAAFAGISFDPKLFEDRQLVLFRELLGRLRDLKSLRGNDLKSWMGLTREMNLVVEGVTLGNIHDKIAKTHKLIVGEFRRIFSNPKLDFSYEEFDQLKIKWGDLDPIFRLVSRFSGQPEWLSEIPVLAEVFSASLQGRFIEFKFRDELALKQTSALGSMAQHWAWERERAMVSVFDPSAAAGAVNRESVLRTIREIVRSNLHAHVSYEASIRSQIDVAEFVTEAAKAPENTLNDLKTQVGGELTMDQAVKIFFNQLAGDILSIDDLSAIKRVAKFMEYLMKQSETVVAIEQREQVASDLSAILQAIQSAESTSSGEAILLSVVNHDPKFLLTIGDLVLTSSCQNYRTGSVIQTLLGYVIDANVQGIASFAIEPSRFRSKKDFETVRKIANSDPSLLQVDFDGNLRIARFKLPDGSVVETKDLGYAYLRNMLKLGSTKDGRPGVFLERDYSQVHRAIEQMRDQHRAILNAVAADIGATTHGQLKIAGSRNPGGQYSDAGGGVHTGGYEVVIP